MEAMHVSAGQPSDWPDGPPESAAITSLLELRDRIDTGKRRAEIIEGRLVVSPTPVIWHEQVCAWLDRRLMLLCDEKGWFIDRAGEIFLPPTSDLIEPDVMVLSDSDDLPDLESRRPLDHVLLVAEVTSRSSIREDREVKPRACALAGIPLYLLVDRFTSPVSVSLFSVPGPDGYTAINTVPAGRKLHVPGPFDLTLDTSSLPLPR
jgi:Uma2 family endonuclease